MTQIGIGIVGGGYMGKAHAVAMSAVGAVFNTALRPKLEMVCATSAASAETYRKAFGFARATIKQGLIDQNAGRQRAKRGQRDIGPNAGQPVL